MPMGMKRLVTLAVGLLLSGCTAADWGAVADGLNAVNDGLQAAYGPMPAYASPESCRQAGYNFGYSALGVPMCSIGAPPYSVCTPGGQAGMVPPPCIPVADPYIAVAPPHHNGHSRDDRRDRDRERDERRDRDDRN